MYVCVAAMLSSEVFISYIVHKIVANVWARQRVAVCVTLLLRDTVIYSHPIYHAGRYAVIGLKDHLQ